MRKLDAHQATTLAVVVLLFGLVVGVITMSGGAVATGTVSYDEPSVTPSTIYMGSAVNGTIRVNNTAGGSAETYAVSLSVDGTVVDWENGTVSAGETQTVTILKTLWETGDHTVTVAGGGQSVSETVTVATANAKYHGGPGNMGFYPNVMGPTNQPVPAWNISDGTPQVMQSTIVGDILYTAFHNGGKLYALDPETGSEYWNATPGGLDGSTWTTPAYANGRLYLGSNAHKLHAIDATDGSEIWNYSTQTNVRSAPAVVDGVVYFASNDGNMTAVDAETGEELWFYTEYQPVLVESNPAVVDGVVYFGSDADNVTALDATTGAKLWNFKTRDEVQSDPTVAQNTVYIGGDSTAGETGGTGVLYALNATDGTERWHYNMSGDVDGGAVYADGTVYAGSRGGDLVALNATEGTKEWNVTGSSFRGAPVVAGDILYISDFGNGTVHAFNTDTGTEQWQYVSPEGTLYPTPLVWDNHVYYGSASHLWAIEQPAPAISNVNATNPSGQTVSVAFDSDTQLATISVSLTGPESTTFTESDFTESGSVGSYTYTATYAGSSDGSYTATVDTAADADDVDGAGGESDSVTVDTVAPTADAGVDLTGDAGLPVAFNASGSTDNVGIASYDWAFGDGATEGGVSPTHAYASDSSYIATLTVTDQGGNTDSDTVTVTTDPAWPSFGLRPNGNRVAPNGSGPAGAAVERWNDTTGGIVHSSPAVVDGTVYVGSDDGNLYAVDAQTSIEQWNYTTGGAVLSSPAVANGTIYVGSFDDRIYALNATDGTERWNYTTSGDVWSSPAVVDGTVYVGSDDGNVYAIDAQTGTEQWNYTTGDLVRSSPAVVSGTVYIGSFDHGVYALNATDGTEQWSYSRDAGGNDLSSPAVVDDTVYIGGVAGSLYALNATDGTERWNTNATDVQSSPTVWNDTVYIGGGANDNNVYAFDAQTGTKQWNYTTNAKVYSTPTVVNGTVYVGSYDNTVYVLDAVDGTERWNYTTGGFVFSSPTVVDETVYVGSADTKVYALSKAAVSITNVAASSPTGQDVVISFTTDKQLQSLSVSLSGPETATLSLADFTERDNGDGSYTYGTQYAANSDGTYTITVDSAVGPEGRDGANGESTSVTVDTTVPTISNFSVTNPQAHNVTVSFNASEQLGTISVWISGAEYATLDRSNFTETGSGPYTYSTTYNGSSDGSYTSTLYTASDASGNNGANSESDSVAIGTAVVDFSIAYLSGTQPDMNNVTFEAWVTGGLLQLQAKNATATTSDTSTEADYELAGVGADSSTLVRMNVTVQNYTPRALIGSGHDVNWSRTNNGDNTWNISVEGTPAAVESYFKADGSSPTTWPGTIQANESQAAALTFAVDDLGVLPAADRERLNGSIMTTDAQEFGTPRYNTTGPVNKTELTVKAPHFAKDGTNNTGFFEAFLPQTLLDDWGVSPNELGGEFDGQSRDTTIRAVDGGVRVDFDIHYSEGNAAITVDTTAPTVSNFSVTNPSGQTVSVALDSTEQLDVIDVTINGTESATLNRTDFTQTGSGPYSYTASYEASTDGEYTATLDTATDAAGNDGSSGQSDSVSISTVSPSPPADTTPPTVSSYDVSGSSGQNIVVSFETNEPLDSISAAVSGAETATLSTADFAASGSGPYSYTATYAGSTDGNYTVTLTTAADAAGNDGASGQSDTVAVDTADPDPGDSTPPTADAGSYQPVAVGQSISFDASGSTDNVGITNYTWNFGDGTTANGSTPSHSYDTVGTYTVSLSVADAAGNTDTDTTTVTVTSDSTQTVAVATADSYVVSVGTDIELRGSDSTIPPGSNATYQWDLTDDGEVDATGMIVNRTFSTPGETTVTLTVSAGDDVVTDRVSITVVDETAPIATVSAPASVGENTTVTLNGSASTDNVGITSYNWTFGDGTTTSGPSLNTVSHNYTAPDSYPVVLTVEDAAGNVDTSRLRVVVAGPDATVSTDSVEFGAIGTNSTSTATIGVSNNGTVPLAVSNATIAGDNASAFSLAGEAGRALLTVRPGETRSVAVAFAPPDTRAHSATLTLETNNTNPASFAVTLSGTGVESDLAPTTSTVAAGNVSVGTDAQRTLTLRNNGGAELTITAIDIVGSDGSQFRLGNGSMAPRTVDSGGELSVPVVFEPTRHGEATANLRVTTRAGTNSSVTLTGVGRAPDIHLSADSVEFSSLGVGASATATVDISNYGNSRLDLSAGSVTGADATSFRVIELPQSIAAGDTATATVQFEPETAGQHRGTVSVATNDPTTPTAAFTISGTAVAATIGVDRQTMDFGNVTVGETVTLDLTVTNTANAEADLTVSRTDIVGRDTDSFEITAGDPPFTLAPGESRDIELAFKPLSAGTKQAQLQIGSNAGNRPLINVWLSNTRTYILVQETTDRAINVDGNNLVSDGQHLINISSPGTQNENATFEELIMSMKRGGSFEMDVVHSETSIGPTFSAAGSQPTQYVQLDHVQGDPDQTFDQTSVTFRIKKTTLPDTVDPEDVRLYRHDNGQWNDLASTTEFLRATATHYVYRVTTPGFSQFVVTTPDTSSDDGSDDSDDGSDDTDDGSDDTDDGSDGGGGGSGGSGGGGSGGSGGGGSGGSGGGGSGSTPSGGSQTGSTQPTAPENDILVDIVRTENSQNTVTIENSQPGSSVVVSRETANVSGPVANRGHISLDEMRIDLNTSRNLRFDVVAFTPDLAADQPQSGVEQATRDRVQSAASAFETETRTVSAGYVDVDHDFETEAVSNVVFEFTVEKAYLDDLGVSPESLTLYRQQSDGWTALSTTYLDSTATHYRFEGTSPGFSVFAVGTNAPQFTVSNATVASSSLSAGETTSVTATVTNRGTTVGEHTVEIATDGTELATETVSVAGGDSQQVTLMVTRPAGEWALTINDEPFATLTVTDEQSSTMPVIIGLLVAGLLAGLFVLWRRSTESDT